MLLNKPSPFQGVGVDAGGLTEQSWREGLAELSTLLARSRAQWKIVIGACLAVLDLRLSGPALSSEGAGTLTATRLLLLFWTIISPRSCVVTIL